MKISIDLVANTGSFETDTARAAKNFKRDMRVVEKAAQDAARAADQRSREISGAFTALGKKIAGALAVREIINFTTATIDSIAGLQDLAEKTGDTASEFATLKLAADVSGVSLETVASASVKLTAQLSKQDEESKGAAEAIKALGLNFDNFKKLAPVEQLDAVSKAMSGFEDGANKTAVAVALFGKSGAELIPFLNDLADQGERVTGLTSEQIKAADDLTKQYARLSSESASLAQQYVSVLIPVFADTLTAIKNVLDQSVDLRDETGKLAGSDAFKEFAQDVVIAVAIAAEAIVGLVKTVQAVITSFATQSNNLKIIGQGIQAAFYFGLDGSENDQLRSLLEERNRLVKKENETYIDLFNYNGAALSEALKKQFAEVKSADNAAGVSKPKNILNFDPAGQKIADEALKKSASELKKFIDEQDNARKTLADLDLSLRTQVDTFGMGEEAVLAYRLSVGDLSDEVARAGPLGEEYAKSIKERSKNLMDAKAAQDAFNTSLANQRDSEASRQGFERQLSDIGAGPASRRFSAGVNNIQDQVTQRTQAVEDRRYAGQIDQGQYEQQLQAVTLFQTQAMAQWDKYFAALEDRNADFSLQFNDALLTYADGLRNIGAELGGQLTGAIESATSATADLAAQTLLWGEGGTEAAKAIARTLITDVVSGFIQAGIKAALFHTLNKAGIVSTTAVSTAAQATTAATAAATNATIAASAAPAAALTSLASFGSNAIPAAIGIALVSGAIGALIAGSFADGGLISGPGSGRSDSILAKVSNGEFVMTAATVNKFGADFFDSLNAGRMPAFANGGLVGSPSRPAMRLGTSDMSGGQRINVNITNRFGDAQFTAGQVRREDDGSLTIEGFIDQANDPGSRVATALARRSGGRVVGAI